jgi:hypothetical protein
MTGFRGTDEQLDREIEAVERIARIRLRRASADLRELERDLRVLRRERARRRAEAPESVDAVAAADAPSA